MSDHTTQPGETAAQRDPGADSTHAQTHRPKHWLREAIGQTMGRWGARFGAAWVGLLALLAVFAPFIANSYPILVSRDQTISSPLLENLGWIDLTLLGVFLLFIVLLFARAMPFAHKLAAFVIIVAALSTISVLLVRPSERQIYQAYRVMQTQGQLDWALWTPIRFSPTDRMRDFRAVEHPMAPAIENAFASSDPAATSENASDAPPTDEAAAAALADLKNNFPNWLGTDRNGSDMLSSMIHATRIALTVGFIAEGLSLIIGVIIGGLMGYFAGWVDLIGLRLVEVFSAIPRLYLLLAFVAFFDRNIYLIMVIIGLTGWTGHAYFARAEFLRLRKQDFVLAARAAGIPLWSVLFRHMLPNGMAPLLVSAGFGVASAILYEATLSFLGLGVVDQPSWGNLLNNAVAEGGGFYWWLATFPGLAIFLSVFAFNLIGEALRDALDPRTVQN